MLTISDLKRGTVLTDGRNQIRIIGLRGKSTLLTLPHPLPISTRTPAAKAYHAKTLLKSWHLVQ